MATHDDELAAVSGPVLLNTVSVDPVRWLARTLGGARWQHVLALTDQFGLAPLSGTSPTVGVAGYHLGGGGSPVLEFTLFPVETLYGGGLFFAIGDAATVLRAWRPWVTRLPVDTNASVALRQLDGQFGLHIRYTSRRPRDEAERLLARIRGAAGTVVDTVDELCYRDAASVFMDPPQPVPSIAGAAALREVTGGTIEALLAQLTSDGNALGRS